MKYTAVLKGEINNEEILVTGNGKITDGLTEGTYDLLKLPDNFNPVILKGMLITGYPNACSSVDGSINVFKGTSYTYQRQLIFNNGDIINMTAICELENEYLTSTFTVAGSLSCTELTSSEPIIETWEPLPGNKLSGLFRITWKAKDGSYLSADAHSIYCPRIRTEQLAILHRYIEIESTVENNTLFLRQDSKLFHRLNRF